MKFATVSGPLFYSHKETKAARKNACLNELSYAQVDERVVSRGGDLVAMQRNQVACKNVDKRVAS
ncbi:hypothetical protein SDJN02_09854, partial [Cucurbita argyrosperma subsp. argyrosperma]